MSSFGLFIFGFLLGAVTAMFFAKCLNTKKTKNKAPADFLQNGSNIRRKMFDQKEKGKKIDTLKKL